MCKIVALGWIDQNKGNGFGHEYSWHINCFLFRIQFIKFMLDGYKCVHLFDIIIEKRAWTHNINIAWFANY